MRSLDTLHALDKFERYDPANPEESLYLRRYVRLVSPPEDAWVYVYNRDPKGAPQVPDNEWKRYRPPQ